MIAKLITASALVLTAYIFMISVSYMALGWVGLLGLGAIMVMNLTSRKMLDEFIKERANEQV